MTVEDKSNLHLLFGTVALKARKYDKALHHLSIAAISESSFTAQDALFKLAALYFETKDYSNSLDAYEKLLTFKLDAHILSNKAAVQLAMNHFAGAEASAREALSLNPRCKSASMNLHSALRSMGRLKDAIEYSCDLVGVPRYPVMGALKSGAGGDRSLVDGKRVHSSTAKAGKSDWIVCCVKWGSKYSSDYVKRLFSACTRNWKHDKKPRYVCFSDQQEDFNSDVTYRDHGANHSDCNLPDLINEPVHIETILLPLRPYEFFWGKAEIFSLLPEGAEVLFLDLDTVIVGDVSTLFIQTTQNNSMLTIRATEMNNERGVLSDEVVNTSLMLWTHQPAWCLVNDLATPEVRRTIHRFDHWMEIMGEGVTQFVQDINKHCVLDYTKFIESQEPLHKDTIILTFPGQLKPHDVCHTCEIVKEHWM